MKTILLFVGILFFVLFPGISGAIVINEFLASNNENISDKDGENHDWIEIYNSGDSMINLQGYHITDDLEDRGWEFPEVLIEPGEYLVVFASGKDEDEDELHTDFRISKDGEPLILSNPEGMIVDEISPLHLPTDLSYGRLPDGGESWYFFDNPTPGKSNETAEGYEGLSGSPKLSREAGFYSEPFELKLSAQVAGADIHYTLDGSQPTRDDPKYKTPLKIEKGKNTPGVMAGISTSIFDEAPDNDIFHSTVVRARVFKNGYMPGPVKTATYIVSPLGDKRYSMPVFSISLAKDSLFDQESGIFAMGTDSSDPNYDQRGHDWEKPSHVEFFHPKNGEYYNLDAGLRTHGGTTRQLPKKSMRIYARRNYGTNPMRYNFFEEDHPVEFKRLILRNAGNDWGGIWGWAAPPDQHRGTVFRCLAAQEIVKDMNFDVQAGLPSVVFLNGEYWGIYNLRERYDRFYVATNYGFDREKVDQLSTTLNADEGEADHYLDLLEYLEENDLSKNEHYEEVKTRMDVENYMEYFIAQIFLGNDDWPNNNIRKWRKRTDEYKSENPYGQDGRWRWMMTDQDWSLGSGLKNAPSDNMLKEAAKPGQGPGNKPLKKLLNHEDFRHEFLRRTCDHLNTTFLPENTQSVIDRFHDMFKPEMREYINRWGVPHDMETWESNIGVVRNYLNVRPDAMQESFGEFFNGGDYYPLSLNANPAEKGYIKLNSIELHPNDFPWKGDYFENLMLEIEAVPFEGARFSGWEGDTTLTDRKFEVSLEEAASYVAVFEEDPDYNRNKTLPEAHDLVDGPFRFDNWPSDTNSGAFPANMAFHQYSEPDPALRQEPDGDYELPYNMESRSRINGLGTEGFSFINTSNPQNMTDAGYVGAALVALQTIDRGELKLSWEAGTILPNNREYGIRVQYRKGQYGPFKDLKNSQGRIAEYIRNPEKEHRQTFNITLPESLNDQPYVLLRFKYYYTEAGTYYDSPTGPRSELAIHNIKVNSEPLHGDPVDDFTELNVYPNPNDGNFTLVFPENHTGEYNIRFYNLQGRKVKATRMQVRPNRYQYPLSLENVHDGIYLMHIEKNGLSETRRIRVE